MAWRYFFDLVRRGSTIGFHLLWHTLEIDMSTRLCLSLWLIWFFCFRFDALTELGAFKRTEFLCISVLRVALRPRAKLASCKSALTPPPHPPPPRPTHPWWFILLTSLTGGPGDSPTLCCFVIYSTRRFVLCLTLCYFVLVFFSPFSIAITSLGEERANLSAFCTFVRFVLVWICRFPLPLSVWEGLRFVIVALPGLFSYFFWSDCAVWSETSLSTYSEGTFSDVLAKMLSK